MKKEKKQNMKINEKNNNDRKKNNFKDIKDSFKNQQEILTNLNNLTPPPVLSSKTKIKLEGLENSPNQKLLRYNKNEICYDSDSYNSQKNNKKSYYRYSNHTDIELFLQDDNELKYKKRNKGNLKKVTKCEDKHIEIGEKYCNICVMF